MAFSFSAKALLLQLILNRAGKVFLIIILPIILYQLKGFSIAESGTILGLGLLGGCTLSLYFSNLADKLGRSLVAGLSALFTGIFLAGAVYFDNPILICLCISLKALAMSIEDPVVCAMLIDETPKELQAHLLAWRFRAINIGLLLGAPIAGLVPSQHQENALFAASLIFSASALLYYFLPYKGIQKTKSSISFKTKVLELFKNKPFFILVAVFTLLRFVHHTFMSVLPLQLTSQFGNNNSQEQSLFQNLADIFSGSFSGPTLFSALVLLNSFLVVVLTTSVARLMTRFEVLSLSKIAIAIFISSTVLLSFYPNAVPALFSSMTLFTLAEVCLWTSMYVVAEELTDEKNRSIGMAALGLSYYGNAISPIISTWFLQNLGASALWSLQVVVLLFALLLFTRMGIRIQPARPQAA